MSFEEDSGDIPSKKVSLKQVSSKKSMFDTNKEEKPSIENFEKRVDQIHKKISDYKSKAGELALAYKKIIFDKTLPQNKNVFIEETEKETLSKMIKLAIEINNDEDEQEGMGTLGWIALILKYFLHHRDRINSLEYLVVQLQRSNDELKKRVEKLSPNIDSTQKSE
jgi:hypothetical protein